LTTKFDYLIYLAIQKYNFEMVFYSDNNSFFGNVCTIMRDILSYYDIVIKKTKNENLKKGCRKSNTKFD